MDYIDKLDEAGKKATAGPWNGISPEESDNGYGYGNCLIINHDKGGDFSDHDQTFIALARNVWPELVAVVREATRFVPDPGTIQWERREVDLKAALAALAAKVGGEG